MRGITAVARGSPEKAAIAGLGITITYSELDERCRALVGALRAGDVKPGDRVAVVAANRWETLEVISATLRGGIVPVPVNRLLTEAEIAYLLEDSGARWLFTDRPHELPPGVHSLVTFGDAYERLLHDASPVDIASYALGRPMHYTSGTTGRPKGVWVPLEEERSAAGRSQDFCNQWGLNEDEIHLLCSPLAHSAPVRFALRTLEAGGTIVLQKRFDARETLAAIELFGVTSTFVVPTHLERIVALGHQAAHFDLSSVRLLAHAGAPIREETKRRVIELFPVGSVWEFYGATEGQATRISTAEWLRRPGSVGSPPPGSEIWILDEEGSRLPPLQMGEVWVADSHAERFEYWGDRLKTKATWRGNAFTVGDLGYLDEAGYLFLVGRRHDVIISGGINVYPQEVEDVLQQHPAVAEVMVYGAPHPEWGQQVKALVVKSYGQPLDPDALRTWARERLASFKCPKEIELVEELPRTPTGKLLRPTE